MQHDSKNAPTNAAIGEPASFYYNELVGLDPQIEWQMAACEQLSLIALLQCLRPECVIEVGSRFGGSMQVFSRFAKRVISCDIDPTCRERLGPKYPNAEFITGLSQQTLPPLLARLQQEAVPVGMILIDGDHSANGVRGDIHAMLDYRPACTMYVVMHDCFNPNVRRGIRTARWIDNPYVHSVELDFIPGVLHHKSTEYRQMWGGFALAILKPERRTGALEVSAKSERHFRALYSRSAHRPWDPQSLARRISSRVRRFVGLMPSA